MVNNKKLNYLINKGLANASNAEQLEFLELIGEWMKNINKGGN